MNIGLGVRITSGSTQIDPDLVAIFNDATVKLPGRDGTMTTTRATQRLCPASGQLKAIDTACTTSLLIPGYGTWTGYGAFRAATNLFLNSDTPATQSITVSAGSVVVHARAGSGYTVTTSAGTATGSGFGSVAIGTWQALTITVGGTITVTIGGTPVGGQVQVEQAAYPSTYVATAGATVTHNADSHVWSAFGGLDTTSGEIVVLEAPYLWSAGAGVAHPSGVLSRLVDNSGTTYIARDAQDISAKTDTGSQVASLSAQADTSGNVRMLTQYWDGTKLSLFRGTTETSDVALSPPWTGPTSLFVGNRTGLDRAWDGFIFTAYKAGGFSTSQRAAFARFANGRMLSYPA